MVKSKKDIVREYAAAVFETAIETWQRPLESVVNALRENPDTLQELQSPAEPFEKRRSVLDRLIPPETSKQVRNFLYLLLQERRLGHLEEILGEFIRLAKPEEAGPIARVVTAVPLNDEERATLEGRLQTRFGADLRLDCRVDPSILGGVFIRVGDVVIDGSLTGRLQRLREQLAADSQ